jgi:hypothetical protein
MALVKCETVGELITALEDGLPWDAPLATLYDWGADVKYGVMVHGLHDVPDDEDDPLVGYVVLDIDPAPDTIPPPPAVCDVKAERSGPLTAQVPIGASPTGGTFVINAGDGTSDPLPFDASDEQKQAAYEQAKSRSSAADKSKFPDVQF